MRPPSKVGQIHPRRVAAAVGLLIVIVVLSFVYGSVLDWLVERSPSHIAVVSIVDLILRAFAILAVAWSVERLIYELLVVGVVERQVRRRVPEIVVGLLAAAVYLAALFVIATTIFGLSPLVVLAVAAGLLVLLGAPFRTVIEDIVAGIVLSFDRSFGIGVVIETAEGRIGKVRRLGVVGTSLMLTDGSINVVRNSSIGRQGYILRAPLGADLRQSLKISLQHGVAAPRAIRLLKGAALATAGIGEGHDPQVLIDDITDQAVIYRLAYGISNTAEAEQIRSALSMTLLRHLNQAGVSLIPQPDDGTAIEEKVTRWDTVDIKLIVDRLSLLSVLTPDERALLANYAMPRTLSEGAMVCRKGEAGGTLFVLAEGVLEVTVEDTEGVRIRLARVEPGDCVGEMSLLTGEPRSADVFARSPALVLEIRSEHLAPILRNRPELADSLAQLMVERQRAKDAAIASSGQKVIMRTDLVSQIAQRIKSFIFSLKS